MAQAGTVRASEVARFDALAARWWDPHGPMRPLHRMNPARIAWIAAQVAAAFPAGVPGGVTAAPAAAVPVGGAVPAAVPVPIAGPGDGAVPAAAALSGGGAAAAPPLRLLDVGCGAGLAAEALAARGFDVLGIDAASAPIAAARAHAAGRGLRLAYRVAAPEELHAEGHRFAIVTALEVVEHVADPAAFVAALAALLQPDGLLVLSTLNRTARAFLAAKLGAEYLLRWLPVGTHDWRRFLTPAELAALVRAAGLRVSDVTGLAPAPLGGGWRTGAGPAVNYLLAARP